MTPLEKTTEVARCCFCGGEDLQVSESRGLRERLVCAMGGVDTFRCSSCKRRFAASPLHSGLRRHTRRKRRTLEERLQPATGATSRRLFALALLITVAAVLGGLVWAEHGFAPFSSLRAPASAGATP